MCFLEPDNKSNDLTWVEKIIFGMFALGIILNAVTPDFPVKEALAQSLSHGGSISVHCCGCN